MGERTGPTIVSQVDSPRVDLTAVAGRRVVRLTCGTVWKGRVGGRRQPLLDRVQLVESGPHVVVHRLDGSGGVTVLERLDEVAVSSALGTR